MANMIARLGVLLGLDTAEFNKGLAAAGQKLDEFVGQAQKGAAVVGAAFVAMATKATMYADEVNDIALANDLAIDSVVKLQNALIASGGQAENAGRLLSSFTSYIDKAAEGSFEAQQAFAKVGVSLQDIGKLTSQDLLTKTIQGLGAIEDPVTRNAKAFEMLGKAAKGVDFVNLAQQMQVTTNDAKEQADAIRALSDMWGIIEKAGIDFMLNFITHIGPSMKATIDYLEQFIGKSSSFGIVFKTVFDTIAVLGANVAFVFQQIGLEIALTYEQAKALITLDFDRFGKVYDEYQEKFKRNRQQLDEFERRILGTGAQAGAASAQGAPAFGGRATRVGVDTEAEKRKREEEKEQKRLSDMYAKAHRARLEEQADIDAAVLAYGRLITSVDEYQNSQRKQIELSEVLADLDSRRHRMADFEYQYQREFINLTAQRTEAIERLKEMDLMPSDREERIKRQNELYQRQVDLIVKIRDTERAKTIGTVGQGFMAEMREFFRTMPTDIETGAAMFGSMMMNMNRALDNFVRTGKLNFKDFARSVIQDLIAIQLKAQAMKLFANLLGFSAGPTTGTTVPVADIPVPGRADGGPVAGGAAYMVGERGPELFVPRMSGTIIPNKSMGMIGNTTQVTNNYINAIDVKSFEERILGSSNAVWAANLYAQKRLPLGAGRM